MATTTAAARRARDKHHYNVMLAACPSRQLLDILSDKWVSLILYALNDVPGGTASSVGTSLGSARRC